eukprot:CAMPEP_0118693914 /NCGR_PEP_ID=MMETSP0800-20121206/12192_1 /TAXON_ID=210618 ORGANISM="Striatella unipunctata, Strain CCMP2910" /NCGR_SAMPLE_ID=MMETSP0800 /ASSEMBLY_ACC=CAM_ASM_000638 /LENGTH=118 /DNA_ID=CAMNT_0006592241 /DNA_START=62 /DNA_END=418 /DNA_ORIENTATION=+
MRFSLTTRFVLALFLLIAVATTTNAGRTEEERMEKRMRHVENMIQKSREEIAEHHAGGAQLSQEDLETKQRRVEALQRKVDRFNDMDEDQKRRMMERNARKADRDEILRQRRELRSEM